MANPRAQRGSLAIQWGLRRLGVEPIPPSRTIERVLQRAVVSRPRHRSPRYESKGVPYPAPVVVEPGSLHQVDLLGPRHLFGGIEFHALNLIDVGDDRQPTGGDVVDGPPGDATGREAATGTQGLDVAGDAGRHAQLRVLVPCPLEKFPCDTPVTSC